VGLYSEGWVRTGVTQESRQNSVGLFAQNETRWLPWLRSVAGLRADRSSVDVTSKHRRQQRRAQRLDQQPKLSLIFGPGRRVKSSSTGATAFTAMTPAA
jgi:outer membrane receptor protein involved in Fe transport